MEDYWNKQASERLPFPGNQRSNYKSETEYNWDAFDPEEAYMKSCPQDPIRLKPDPSCPRISIAVVSAIKTGTATDTPPAQNPLQKFNFYEIHLKS